MHGIAAVSSGPVGLAGGLAGSPTTGEPPLSTETIGRGPSFLELPAPLHAVAASDRAEEQLEGAGEWPEVEGRHLHPASILSIDVLVAS